MQNVKICSMKMIQDYNKKCIDESFVRISVTDWDKTAHIKLNHKLKQDELFLEFQDITPEEIIKYPEFKCYENYIFSADQAKTTFQFIKKNKDSKFIINCHAGISRSAAIAKMVCKMKGLDSSWIGFPKYNPNPYVLELLEKEYMMDRMLQFCDKYIS